MQQAMQSVILNPGTSYWVALDTPKGRRKMPLTVISMGHGQLMGADHKGRLFNLPDGIVKAHSMNEWARLRWAARCYGRIDGDHVKAHELTKEAYKAMPDAWYIARIEHLTVLWNGGNNDVLCEQVDELRRFRPDLPADELTFVKKQREQLLHDAEYVDRITSIFSVNVIDELSNARLVNVPFIKRAKSFVKSLF